MTNLRDVAAGRLLRWACGSVGAQSSARRHVARIFSDLAWVGLILLVVLSVACASGGFREFRACDETKGSNLHDPGTVVDVDVDDNQNLQYVFLSDRNRRDDPRNTVLRSSLNRSCPLVTGVTSDTRTPIGELWDLTERTPQ